MMEGKILQRRKLRMSKLKEYTSKYLDFCHYQKRLDSKTQKAYQIDLLQFTEQFQTSTLQDLTTEKIEEYIASLNQTYKPKTVKRKIASVKAFFRYLEYKDMIEKNPFAKVQIKLREPVILPKTIPIHTIEILFSTLYKQYDEAKTTYQKKNILRDAAVLEILFATGMRISELCSLKTEDVDFIERTILIYGKGAKERRIQIANNDVIHILQEYKSCFWSEIQCCHHFFVNQSKKPLSDQSVRRMINKYTSLAAIELHITPHMFRHTFATSLLEADVDIRYIQEMLGHSSITVTEIYTHVAMAKQRDILTAKHPRNHFHIAVSK